MKCSPAESDQAAVEHDEDDDDDAEEDGGGAGDGATSSGGPDTKKLKRSQVVLADGRVVNVQNVRNHVNPLLPHFQKPVPVPAGGDWSQVFKDLSKPIVLDIGSAKGRFCLEGAKQFPAFNWLGVEIREALVVRANQWSKEEDLPNLHYIFGNASAGMADLLQSLPAGRLQRVTIQCPDPWFKKKHQKRRMLTDKLAKELATHMPVGAVVFVQSDVEQVSMQIADFITVAGGFARVATLPSCAGDGSVASTSAAVEPVPRPHATFGRDYQDKAIGGGEWENKGAGAVDDSYHWLEENPIGLLSERESSTMSRGLPMFRALFQRVATEASHEV